MSPLPRPAPAAPSPGEARAFIKANTAPGRHPLVPEIRLHLAGEMTPIWRASEDSLKAAGVEPPFWAFVWPGGAAMARHILDHPALAAGRDVLDIAAGSAVAAIAAARAGARRVRASDIDATARAAIAANAALNGVSIEAPEADLLAAPAPEVDLILAADVFYDRALAARIGPWLAAARAKGSGVLISDPGRTYLPAAGLEALARYAVPTPLDLEDRELCETVIYRLKG